MKLDRSAPEAEGVSPRAIVNFLNAVKEEKHEMHSFMLLKNGKVICERWWAPYEPQSRHMLFSLSKSFTSTAIGFALNEGLLTVDTPLADTFKQEFEKIGQAMDDEVRAMTVKNLLTMSTGMEYEAWVGFGEDTDGDKNNIESFLSAHIKDAPGQTFRYSTIATYMLSAAVTRLTGETLAVYLKPRLFDPLGIRPFWQTDEKTGVHMGGFGLNITTEDIAKFGQLYLQKGVWEGKQLIPSAWVEEATGRQIMNGKEDEDWGMGYGYQFWRCMPEGVYRGDGMFGQYCVVIPAENIVIAATSNVDMGRVLKLFWAMLEDIRKLPASDSGAASELVALNNFTHLAVDENGGCYPELLAEYEFDAKQISSATFDSRPGECVLTLYTKKGAPPAMSFLFTENKWNKAASPYYQPDKMIGRVMTYGNWVGCVFTVTTWFYETASREQHRFTFSEDFSEVMLETRGGEFNSKFEKIGNGKRKPL
jgi:CubicO group peptidase (beta-lactamase class C family)